VTVIARQPVFLRDRRAWPVFLLDRCAGTCSYKAFSNNVPLKRTTFASVKDLFTAGPTVTKEIGMAIPRKGFLVVFGRDEARVCLGSRYGVVLGHT
jgi:hypothetical protein